MKTEKVTQTETEIDTAQFLSLWRTMILKGKSNDYKIKNYNRIPKKKKYKLTK